VYSSGDQFFLPDNSQFYFSDLPGEKYLRYVPNTDHSMASLDALTGLLAWFRAVTGNVPRPRFYWNAERQKGTLRVRTLDQPSKVLLWQASNPKARDFRLESIGPAWTSTPLTGVNGMNGIYDAALPAPSAGFTAFFVELTFPRAGDLPLVFTTEVMVVPDVYPFLAPVGAGAASPAGWRRRPPRERP
jgi:PhoPQ-activated pathogenicity-related protein